MVRAQVHLTEEQHRELRQAARRAGISMTALLRRMVEREVLVEAKRRDPIMGFVGLGSSGRSDVSDNHDEALAEAFCDDGTHWRRRVVRGRRRR